jgi:hypothetical protein
MNTRIRPILFAGPAVLALLLMSVPDVHADTSVGCNASNLVMAVGSDEWLRHDGHDRPARRDAAAE